MAGLDLDGDAQLLASDDGDGGLLRSAEVVIVVVALTFESMS